MKVLSYHGEIRRADEVSKQLDGYAALVLRQTSARKPPVSHRDDRLRDQRVPSLAQDTGDFSDHEADAWHVMEDVQARHKVEAGVRKRHEPRWSRRHVFEAWVAK